MESFDCLQGDSTPSNGPDKSFKQVENNEVDRADSAALYDISQHDSQTDVAFDDALKEVKKGLDTIFSTINRSSLAADPETQLFALENTISNHVKFKPPTSKTIAFAGDSGAGKSSVINSILDKQYLAHSDSDGIACTSVIMEFRNADKNHSHPFTIETEIMGPESRSLLLSDFLAKYRLYHASTFTQPRSNVGKGHNKRQIDIDPEEEADRKRQAEGAKEALECLFQKGHAYVQHEFLTAHSDFDNIHQKLVKEIDAKINKEWDSVSLMSTTNVDSLEDCKKILRCLGGNSISQSNTAWWPLIKIIRVYLQSEILATGLVLADSPGFRDLNFAREDVTSKYLSQCDGVFIAADINRCCSDKTINSIRSRCGGRANRLVCTKSDVASLSEAANKDDDFADSLKTHVKKHDEAERKLNALKNSYGKARNKKPTRKLPKEEIERHALELSNKIYQLEANMKRDEFSSQKLLCDTKNERIREKLKVKYPDLEVFFVSNKIYWEHFKNISSRSNPDDNSSPEDADTMEDGSIENEEEEQEENEADDIEAQWVKLSGIDVIRRHCHSIILNTRMAAISSHLTQDLPSFLSSVKVWLSGVDGVKDVVAANEINQVLEYTKKRLHEGLVFQSSETTDGLEKKYSLLQSYEQELKTEFEQRVLDDIANKKSEWVSTCLGHSAEWRSWKSVTFQSFCRKYGDHATPKVGSHCWNEDIICSLHNALSDYCPAIERKVESLAGLNNEINQLFHEVEGEIETCLSHAPLPISALLESMEQKRMSLNEDINTSLKNLAREISNLLREIRSHDEGSVIYKVMRHYYRKTTKMIGLGSDLRRKRGLDEFFEDDLCDKFHHKTERLFNETKNRCFKALHASASKVFKEIVGDVECVMAKEGKVAEAVRDPERTRELRENVQALEASMEHAISHLRRFRQENAGDTLTLGNKKRETVMKRKSGADSPKEDGKGSVVGCHQSAEPRGEDLEHCTKRPRLSQTTEANEASSTELEMKSHSPVED